EVVGRRAVRDPGELRKLLEGLAAEEAARRGSPPGSVGQQRPPEGPDEEEAARRAAGAFGKTGGKIVRKVMKEFGRFRKRLRSWGRHSRAGENAVSAAWPEVSSLPSFDELNRRKAARTPVRGTD